MEYLPETVVFLDLSGGIRDESDMCSVSLLSLGGDFNRFASLLQFSRVVSEVVLRVVTIVLDVCRVATAHRKLHVYLAVVMIDSDARIKMRKVR